MRYVIYGAGINGKKALYNIGKDKVAFFIDASDSTEIDEIPVYPVEIAKNYIEKDMLVLISSEKYKNEMQESLKENGIYDYLLYRSDIWSGSNSGLRLQKKDWEKLYNRGSLIEIENRLRKTDYKVWTHELLRLTKQGNTVLEIGCGSGETSVALAMADRKVTALDYSEESLLLVDSLADRMKVKVNTVCADATKKLQFENEQFDVVFQAGLLEHFEKEQRIELLKNWKQVSKTMISMIPNASSLAYRIWKYEKEQAGTWNYGLELPQNSLYEEFEKAGYKNIREYSIGSKHAISLLPDNHFLKIAMQELLLKGYDLDSMGQGYLLVSIGLA